MTALYLHIPFCAQKCPYCDFFSVVGNAEEIEAYSQLLLQELELLAAKSAQTEPLGPLDSIFFGGGTPSLLSPRQIGAILARLDRHWGITANTEISLEANPGTLDRHKVAGYAEAGVNRLSLGIQSLNDQALAELGRIHDRTMAVEAVAAIRDAGIDNLNLDLIFARPGQNGAALDLEIDALLALEPEHVSLYGLSFEEGTEYHRRLLSGALSPCPDELYAAQYEQLRQRLTAAGFEHYEISNFARPGRRCRHNEGYWQRRTCLAAGCGAHGFSAMDWGSRYHIPADLTQYRRLLEQRQLPHQLLETFSREEAMSEAAYLALRTADGISLSAFKEAYGAEFSKVFDQALKQTGDYGIFSEKRYRLSAEGWSIYDHLISRFLL